jgi:MOSC domain-containing protein YiiM
MVKRFLRSGRSGIYFRVEREGELGAGDTITRIARDERGVTVADIVSLYSADDENRLLLERASDHPSLPGFWRERFRQRLWNADG